MVPVQRLHTPSILHPLALSLCYAVSSPGGPSRSLCALAYSARGLRGVHPSSDTGWALSTLQEAPTLLYTVPYCTWPLFTFVGIYCALYCTTVSCSTTATSQLSDAVARKHCFYNAELYRILWRNNLWLTTFICIVLFQAFIVFHASPFFLEELEKLWQIIHLHLIFFLHKLT